ncbi:sodium channel protein Nach [Galleria mellonella]|uniref:Sodium channel protein Nach n=1 Tax=Galleria mellonella TaxID=7137 RepID=A0A6J3BXY0_GALME|nr:sodium channel protein Nach [Galleria mellonella]
MSYTCKALIKDYCANCTFAGIRFIADDTKHWTERCIWVVFVFLGWYGSAVLIIAAWNDFVLNPISFGLDTVYTDWNTKMPAVAICEFSNDERIYEVADKIWSTDHLLDLEDALRDIAYFRGYCFNLVDFCYNTKKPEPKCPMSNYSYYANLVRSDCHRIIQNCSYNNVPFDCCEYFLLMPTDIGTCYVVNSIQTEKSNSYPMICNNTVKRGSIKFDVLLTSMLYTLGEDEIPSVTSLRATTLKIQLGRKYRRLVAVNNIQNDPLVADTTTQQRACRFYSENEGGMYPHYSYSACITQCRKQAQLKLCGCHDHFIIATSEAHYCNISGMACLHAHVDSLINIKPPWSKRPGQVCQCLPSCDETEVTVIKDRSVSERLFKKKKSEVEIVLAHIPAERFKRNVVRSRLDLVVSVGGTTGLFVGASLISFIELIFYFTVRFISNILMDKRNQKRNVVLSIQGRKKYKRINLGIEQKQTQGPYVNSGVLNSTLIVYDSIYEKINKRHH